MVAGCLIFHFLIIFSRIGLNSALDAVRAKLLTSHSLNA